MAELLYPTSVDVSGPWLVSAAQLEALDQIVDREMVSLEGSLEKRLLKLLEERVADRLKRGLQYTEEEKAAYFREERAEQLNYSSFQLKREVRITLADERKIFSKAFREAASHPEIELSRIVGFVMELGNGETRCELSIGRIGGSATDLQLSVFGGDRREREELFSTLLQWVNDVQAPSWQQRWNRFVKGGYHLLLGSAAVLIIGIVDLATVFTASRQSPYKDAAHALLAKGMTSNDVAKAVEIILALESNYNPSRHVASWGAQELQVAVVVFCVMLSIRPRFEIGLGKGRNRIARWNLWTWFVAVSLPAFVVSTVASKMLENILHLH